MMNDQLKKIKDLTWDEVFNQWKSTEGSNPAWQEIAIKDKGWGSWEEWRKYKTSQIQLEQREWALYEIQDPMTVVPDFLIGPFKTWQQFFERKMTHSFADIVSEHAEWISSNPKITELIADFPNNTQFIGMYCIDGGKIIIFEGHHRAAAIALAAAQGKSINFDSSPMIAVTKIDTDDYLELIGLADEGSEKPR